jgi:hypothetical protein
MTVGRRDDQINNILFSHFNDKLGRIAAPNDLLSLDFTSRLLASEVLETTPVRVSKFYVADRALPAWIRFG